MDEAGAPLAVTTAIPDGGGLAALADRVGGFGDPVYAAIESMNGARFVHDQLEMAGWQVEIADAQKVKGWPRWPARPTRIARWVGESWVRGRKVPAEPSKVRMWSSWSSSRSQARVSPVEVGSGAGPTSTAGCGRGCSRRASGTPGASPSTSGYPPG